MSVAMHDFVPTTTLHGMDEFVEERDYYDRQDQQQELNANEGEEEGQFKVNVVKQAPMQ